MHEAKYVGNGNWEYKGYELTEDSNPYNIPYWWFHKDDGEPALGGGNTFIEAIEALDEYIEENGDNNE